MALTFTKQKEGVAGDLRYWTGTITFDSSYPSDGEAVTAANFGFGSTIYILDIGSDDGLMFQFDRTNLKIKVLYPTGGGAAAPTTVGQPSSAGTTAAGGSTIQGSAVSAASVTVTMTPGAAKEVGDTADLSAVIAQVFALGQ